MSLFYTFRTRTTRNWISVSFIQTKFPINQIPFKFINMSITDKTANWRKKTKLYLLIRLNSLNCRKKKYLGHVFFFLKQWILLTHSSNLWIHNFIDYPIKRSLPPQQTNTSLLSLLETKGRWTGGPEPSAFAYFTNSTWKSNQCG